LTVHLPGETFLQEAVQRVTAEGPYGSFALLPRHIDMATALTVGILSFVSEAGEERFVAVDGGILVKVTDQVLVATRRAVRGELGILKKTVEHMVAEVDERERKARSAMARLEADFMRRFVEFGKRG
jgi:F-type H+-transporting ATPase subunit epsilon